MPTLKKKLAGRLPLSDRPFAFLVTPNVSARRMTCLHQSNAARIVKWSAGYEGVTDDRTVRVRRGTNPKIQGGQSGSPKRIFFTV